MFGVGSHVTFSVESETERNYWPEAAIRSNRFRLFTRSSGQVPEGNGQAKAFVLMDFPRKLREISGLHRATGPADPFHWTGTAKRTVLTVLSFPGKMRSFEAPA
jgi:hypothetical protein